MLSCSNSDIGDLDDRILAVPPVPAFAYGDIPSLTDVPINPLEFDTISSASQGNDPFFYNGIIDSIDCFPGLTGVGLCGEKRLAYSGNVVSGLKPSFPSDIIEEVVYHGVQKRQRFA